MGPAIARSAMSHVTDVCEESELDESGSILFESRRHTGERLWTRTSYPRGAMLQRLLVLLTLLVQPAITQLDYGRVSGDITIQYCMS